MILLVILATLAIALTAQWQVKRMYRRFSEVPAAAGCTGAEVAMKILRNAGVRGVEIVEHDEFLGDHYDPRHKTLVLSSANYHGSSIAALGVAAHEAGHALQHHAAYTPLRLRMAAVGVTNFASQIVTFLPFRIRRCIEGAQCRRNDLCRSVRHFTGVSPLAFAPIVGWLTPALTPKSLT